MSASRRRFHSQLHSHSGGRVGNLRDERNLKLPKLGVWGSGASAGRENDWQEDETDPAAVGATPCVSKH